MPVSKEIARIFYRNTTWYKEVGEAGAKRKIGHISVLADCVEEAIERTELAKEKLRYGAIETD